MVSYSEINDSFCSKRTISVKDNNLAVKHIYEYLKCIINKLELKEYKSLVFISDNKIIGFDINDDYELKELVKLYIKYFKKQYEIKIALGLGNESIENFIEFKVCLQLHNNDSIIFIPNIKNHIRNDSGYAFTIGNNRDNSDIFNLLIQSVSSRIMIFLNYEHNRDELNKKIIELIAY